MYTRQIFNANFKTAPYSHQLYELETHGLDKARGLLWQMRTGKSKTIIDTACMLYQEVEIDAVLLFAPNKVHNNWIKNELPLHHWDNIPRICYAWNTKAVKLPQQERTFKAAMNTSGLAWFAFASATMTREDVRKYVATVINNRQVLVVFDESHDYRTPGSKRSVMARHVARECKYRRILTGTSVTNSPLHAWGQLELLEPGGSGFKKYGGMDGFKSYYTDASIGGYYDQTVSFKNLDELEDTIKSHCTIIKREDCSELPDIVHRTRHIELTQEQQRIYKEIVAQFWAEVNQENIFFNAGTVKILKLQQVCSGFIVDKYGDYHSIPGGNPRIDALIDELSMTDGKTIVWCTFQRDLDLVATALTKERYKFLQYHGRTKDADKEYASQAFRPESENEYQVFLGQPAAGGTGLNLGACDNIIWFTHTFNAITREQANERATRIGGKNIQIVDLVAPGADEYILETLANKQSVADRLTKSNMEDVLKAMQI